jgi:integrase
VEGSFETILDLAGIREFRFHDLRHTFASWYIPCESITVRCTLF